MATPLSREVNEMKIMTILGTRPEIIRLSRIIPKLDRLCDHVLVHTGQNYDPKISDIFFVEMGIRSPNHVLAAHGDTCGRQIAQIIEGSEKVMLEEKPERLLLLGDTNSSLSAIIAKRLDIPVFHMEAGNRCYDDRVPEEINRRIIDHSSDVLMPYTERSRHNLLREGIAGERIFVTGNPIHEVIRHYEPNIQKARVLESLSVEKGRYILVTMHRAENVDIEEKLKGLATALTALHNEYRIPVIVSTHPRTRNHLRRFGIPIDKSGVKYLEPFGFYDFIALERNAFCVLSDSGTVQEECAIFGVPNVTIREVTERPETLECGSNILSGVDPANVMRCVKSVLALNKSWAPPPEYLMNNVSDTVVKIILGYVSDITPAGSDPPTTIRLMNRRQIH